MKRMLAWIILFVQKVKAKLCPKEDLAGSCYHKGLTDVKDLLQAERVTTKLVQWLAFAEEMTTLLTCGIEVKVSSSIQKLDPFVRSSDILRVGGRLKRSKVNQ